MKTFSYCWCFAVVILIGCSVQQHESHRLTKWNRLGVVGGQDACQVHAAVFREAATTEWENPSQLSKFLVKRITEELPKTYKSAGALLAIEFADGWDSDKASKILNELADGYEAHK